MKFLNRVTKTVKDYGLIQPGDTVLAGVSGGPDSMALLEALDHFRPAWGLNVIAVHVNHGLRPSAITDDRFVQKICRKKNITCETIAVNISKNSGISLEQAAREKRFNALIKAAKKYHANAIALGHHQDDLAETVLMRLLRGSGLQGLQAILPERMIHQLRFIRPMLETSREDILTFLSENNVPFREDPTNKNTKFLRNKIRHQLIPHLKGEYNQQITQALSGLAETSALDYEFLNNIAEDYYQKILINSSKKSLRFSLDKLRQIHPSMQRMIFRKAITALTTDNFAFSLHHIHKIEMFLNPSTIPTILELPHHLNILRVNENVLEFNI